MGRTATCTAVCPYQAEPICFKNGERQYALKFPSDPTIIAKVDHSVKYFLEQKLLKTMEAVTRPLKIRFCIL